MIPAAFDYVAPTSVADALAALAKAGDDGKVIAGGQSLLPVLKMRLNAPATLVDLGRIAELSGVRDDGDAIVIGAMTTHDAALRDPLVREHALLLALALETVADPQIRHRGTVGGSAAHADPAGDVGTALAALDAEMVIAGQGGERRVGSADFFTDLFETAVGEGELLTAIRVPKHTGWVAHYEKFQRTAQQWAIVAVGATLKVDGGAISAAKVGLGNMGATPLRASGVESALVGKGAGDVAAAAAQAADGTNPPSDLNGDAAYRKHLAVVLTRRAVAAALGG